MPTGVAESVNGWFTPANQIMALIILFFILVAILQMKWTHTCNTKIEVLEALQSGGGKFILAPKEGGKVTIKNPTDNTTRVYPINELATIDVLYPGIGFIPAFMQKTIRMAIVSEGDWEPLLNRSPHMRKIASPDMVEAFKSIAVQLRVKDEKDVTANQIMALISDVSTSPTRAMIASPALLGNLMEERVSEIVATVTRDIMNPLLEAVKKIKAQVNPTVVYIGLGLVAIIGTFTAYQIAPVASQVEKTTQDIQQIKDALGIKPVATNNPAAK